jgi:hypothetical protein
MSVGTFVLVGNRWVDGRRGSIRVYRVDGTDLTVPGVLVEKLDRNRPELAGLDTDSAYGASIVLHSLNATTAIIVSYSHEPSTLIAEGAMFPFTEDWGATYWHALDMTTGAMTHLRTWGPTLGRRVITLGYRYNVAGADLGNFLTVVPDVDADGVDEIAIGYQAVNAPVALVLVTAEGDIKSVVEFDGDSGDGVEDSWGGTVLGVDVNGDGVGDLVVADRQWRGRFHPRLGGGSLQVILLGPGGVELSRGPVQGHIIQTNSTTPGFPVGHLNADARFGSFMVSLPNLRHPTGATAIGVSAPYNDDYTVRQSSQDFRRRSGSFFIVFLASDGTIVALEEMSANAGATFVVDEQDFRGDELLQYGIAGRCSGLLPGTDVEDVELVCISGFNNGGHRRIFGYRLESDFTLAPTVSPTPSPTSVPASPPPGAAPGPPGCPRSELTVHGFFFIDQAGDGTFDLADNDVPQPGVEVSLAKLDGSVIATTVSDADGYYSFEDLEDMDVPDGSQVVLSVPSSVVADTYRASALGPNNDFVTSGTGSTVTLTSTVTLSGGCDMIVDGGLQPQPCVESVVWEDVNGNGCREDGEPPVAGVDVTLVDSVLGINLATATTDEQGVYKFSAADGMRGDSSYTLRLSLVQRQLRSFRATGSSDFCPSLSSDGTLDVLRRVLEATVSDIPLGACDTVSANFGVERRPPQPVSAHDDDDDDDSSDHHHHHRHHHAHLHTHRLCRLPTGASDSAYAAYGQHHHVAANHEHPHHSPDDPSLPLCDSTDPTVVFEEYEHAHGHWHVE